MVAWRTGGIYYYYIINCDGYIVYHSTLFTLLIIVVSVLITIIIATTCRRPVYHLTILVTQATVTVTPMYQAGVYGVRAMFTVKWRCAYFVSDER